MNSITLTFNSSGVGVLANPSCSPTRRSSHQRNHSLAFDDTVPVSPAVATIRLHAKKPNGDVTNALVYFVKEGDVWKYVLPNWFTEYAGILTLSVSVQFEGYIEGFSGEIITRNTYSEIAALTPEDGKLYVALDTLYVYYYTYPGGYIQDESKVYEVPADFQRTILCQYSIHPF